jgi:hypothetical protein
MRTLFTAAEACTRLYPYQAPPVDMVLRMIEA